MFEQLQKKHFGNAATEEKIYLIKEPTGKTAEALIEVLAAANLSAIQAKGCLEYAKYLVDFRAHLNTTK